MSYEIPKLGTLTRIDLREVWKSEPYSFTPWLAESENLNALAQVLELDALELVQTEQQVSEFSVDIVAKIAGSDDIVVIENQLERTDHRHLGQAITYAAGTQAKAIVWVAPEFAEGHRAAIDWLNRMTPEDIGFFGVEVGAVRIGDSVPAPVFTVVARPNNWARQVRDAATAPGPDALKNIAYWAAFNLVAEAKGLRANPRRETKGNNIYVLLQRSEMVEAYASAYLSRSKAGEIGAYLYLKAPDGETMDAWRAIFEPKLSELSEVFGAPLRVSGQRGTRLIWILCSLAAHPDESSDWERQHDWLAEHMIRMRHLYREQIAPLLNFDLSPAE